jgi:hypothetical protein
MYRFVPGHSSPTRNLSVLGQREHDDRDDVADARRLRTPAADAHVRDDELSAVYTRQRLSTEVRGLSSQRTTTSKHSGTRSVVSRVFKRTTTVTRGEERSLTEDLLSRPQHHGLVHPPTRVALDANASAPPRHANAVAHYVTSKRFKVRVASTSHFAARQNRGFGGGGLGRKKV